METSHLFAWACSKAKRYFRQVRTIVESIQNLAS